MIALLLGIRLISPARLQALLPAGELTLVDVNARQSWARARVPGAVNLDPERYTRTELPQDAARLLVFYCSGPLCRKAPLAARRARAMGFGRVRVLGAGISGWLAAGLPVESGEQGG